MTREKANQYIRDLMRTNGVPQWKVAELAGVSENTIQRWLRTPLTQYRQERIIFALRQIIAMD